MAAITSRMPKMGFDADGKITGFKVDTIANLGAYMSLFSSVTPTYLYATLCRASTTSRTSTATCGRSTPTPCRSMPIAAPGGPEACYMIERMMETAARELGVDPAELRRKNFIREFPYETPVIMTYDAGDFDGNLDKARSRIGLAGFAARKAEAASRGKLRGIGLFLLHRGLRHRAVGGCRLARRGCWPLGKWRRCG